MSATWTRCVILLLIAAGAYFPTWVELWSLWETKGASYSHGVLIAGTFLWLVWRARPALNAIPATADKRALPLVVLLSIAWLLAARANVLMVYTMLWPALAFTLLWAGAGWQAARKLTFALVFLYFAIPIWDYLEPLLHFIAAHVVSFLFGITGTQATVDGTYILLPQATILIALACSGAHFLAISLAMGALAGELRDDTPRMRLLILTLAGLLGIASNAIRILLIVVAYLNPKLQAGFEEIGHLTFGWWIFAFDIALFFLTLRLLPLSNLSATPPVASSSAATGKPAGFALAIASALFLPLIVFAPRSGSYPDLIPEAVSVPGATGPLSPDSRWEPRFTGAAWGRRTAYLLRNGRVIELYGNEYHRQSEGAELFSSHGDLFPPQVFSEQTKEAIVLRGPDAAAIDAWRVQLRDRAGRDWSAIYTYTINGASERDSRRTRLQTALWSFYGHPTAGVFAVLTPCVPDCGAVAADMDNFAVSAYGAYEFTRNKQ